jgi:hypothetical protein
MRFVEPPRRVFAIGKGLVEALAEEWVVAMHRQERPGPYMETDFSAGMAWCWEACLTDRSAGGGLVEGEHGETSFRSKRAVYGVLSTGAVDVYIAADNGETVPVQVGDGLYLGLAPIGQAIIITFRDAEGAIVGSIAPERER